MSTLRFLSALLPIMALAACEDSTISSAASAPTEVSMAKSRGELIAREACAQCHGPDFYGQTVGSMTCPSLSVVMSLSFDAFDAKLTEMTSGEDAAMAAAAAVIQALSTEDRRALHLYLAAERAEKQ